MSEVHFYTEAGPHYGFGHLMRCQALAEGFAEKGFSSHFYVRGLTETPDNFPFPVVLEDWLGKTLVNGNVAVVDSYHADQAFCSSLLDRYKGRVLFLDDTNRIPYPGGWVLNGVMGTETIPYPVNPRVSYFLGPEYQPLRRPFWDVPAYQVRPEVKRVLVTFGGSDITNETPGVLENLSRFYPNWEKRIIIGSGFTNTDEIRQKRDSHTEFIENADALTMRRQMLVADLCISAAGQTLSELARVGVPVLGVQVADNQTNNVNHWQAAGYLNLLETWPLSESFLAYENRLALSRKGQTLMDGQGVRRVVKVMEKEGLENCD